MQLVLKGAALAHKLEHTDTCSNQAGSHRVREEVWTATLAQHVDNLLLTCCETTHGTTEGLTQGTCQDFDLTAQVVTLCYTTTGLTNNAGTVAFVNHYHGIVLLSQLVDLVQGANITVHREDAVCYDNTEAVLLGSLQLLLEVGHVSIGITVTLCLAETNTVDDRSVVQGIRDDGILICEQRLEYTTVSIEAGCVEDGILGAEELGNLLLQLLMKILTSADETYTGHTKATCIHTLLGGLNQFLVTSKTQIVVGAEVKALLTLNQNLSTLRALDDALVLVQTSCLNFSQFLLQMFLKFCIHDEIYFKVILSLNVGINDVFLDSRSFQVCKVTFFLNTLLSQC